MIARPNRWFPSLLALTLALVSPDLHAQDLETTLGRSEVRVYSEPFELATGGSIWGYALADRLERLDYRRVSERPDAPGEYFWGHEIFWIYRRAFRHGGDEEPARLLGLEMHRDDGTIVATVGGDDEPVPSAARRLEPEVLAETFEGRRARRHPIDLDHLPESVWRPVLAAEDARFFDHSGVDARSLARALLANLRAGKVTQGGSTITQQLIKNRDLTPQRSMGRKASEAMRALALEAEYDKREILQAYLNQVYLGHVEGLAIHGLGTAARCYFSRPVEELDLAQAALLAAIIQGPNRLSPIRHPERARQRRDWVLGRIEELGWAETDAVRQAREEPIRLVLSEPAPPPAAQFVDWVESVAHDEARRRLAKGRGIVAETTLDPWLQQLAEETVAEGWRDLARRHGGEALGIALVALDATSGAVLAHVGGDPRTSPVAGGFDRARQARRQPGSAVKPLLLLEAFERCGDRRPLFPARRVADEPLTMDLPSGPWSPRNADGEFHGIVTLRQALVDSLNIPFVRIARHCGFEATARRLRRAGLEIPPPPPPALALGAVEVTPLELAAAFSALANGGLRVEPRPVSRLERPEGRRIERFTPRDRRVASAETAYLVTDLLYDAVARGTARGAAIEGWNVAAKTGTTSERRDAWLAGWANGIVTVVWVGRDDARSLGATGGGTAAPLWQRFMEKAVGSRPRQSVEVPAGIVELHIDRRTGLLVRAINPHADLELFRRGATPRRDRFFRVDDAAPVIE